jgi:thiol-disulfide isomerase/thioredoxin
MDLSGGFVQFLFLASLITLLPPQAAPLPRVGQPAPPYVFSEIVSAGSIAGPASVADLTPDRLRGKVIVLDFFATWCVPCVASIPNTNKLIEDLRNQPVVVLAVSNEERAVLERFIADKSMQATLVRDAGGQTYTNYSIAGLPFVVINGRDGRIAAFTHPSRLSRELIEGVLRGDSSRNSPKR